MRKRALAALTALTILRPAPAHADGPVTIDTAYPTANGGQYLAEVTYTPGAEGKPWLVIVHGGGWTHGSLVGMRPEAATFAADGFVTININYPLEPALFTDMRDAVTGATEWAHSNAAAYGADPDRGAVFGFSAGGHLALTAGLIVGPADGVKAILVASGVVDPRRLAKDALQVRDYDLPSTQGFVSVYDRATELSGCGFRAIACWSQIQPDTYAGPGDPPVLMMSGSLDRTVPLTSGEYEAGLLTARGVDASWQVVPDLGHTALTGMTPDAVLWLETEVGAS